MKLLSLLFCAGAAFAATGDPFDKMIDRAIVQENALLAKLRTERPIAETYVQELDKDADFGTVPKTDHYFLGKADFSQGLSIQSFLPGSGKLQSISQIFAVHFYPKGFAQMMLMDGGDLSRAMYTFEYVRREFLGDVRCWVVNVKPSADGHFVGQIWIEDRGFHIVRFNGTYSGHNPLKFYTHFDSWRVNCGPDLWMPYASYSEESDMATDFNLRKIRFKAVTRFWGYTTARERDMGEFTNVTFDAAVDDQSAQASDTSPVEALRAWQRRGEDNILNKLESSNLLAREGEVDKVLDTVANNLAITNNLNIEPAVRVRVMLTTPLETFTVGHTIVVSRGLLDTLPGEAALAAAIAHELAHIALGQVIDTKYAFSDRVLFDDDQTLRKFRLQRSPAEEDQANEYALKLLVNSPYKDNLSQAGLFLKALGQESGRLPELIKPLFGSPMADRNNVLRMAALIQSAPQLQTTRTEQVAALPLGARTKLDPWSDDLKMSHTTAVPLLSAKEKMPFELTPIYLHLSYADESRASR